MWVEFEIEYGAVPESGEGLVLDTFDAEIHLFFRNNTIPFEEIWSLCLEAAERKRVEKGFLLLWVRTVTPDDTYVTWASGVSPYGVLEDDLIIES